VVTPAVDYALSRPDVDGDHLALMGMSLGGYFAARAAAFEHRFRAAVFFNGIYSFHESIRGSMPEEAIAALDAGDPIQCEEITYKAMQNNTNLHWAVTQCVWSFGASGLADFLSIKVKPFTMEGFAKQIQCPCLVLDSEGDILAGGNQAQEVYDALKAPKQLVRFSSEDGAENHCESGALAYKDEVVFNWLDEALKLHDGRSG
jgi:pimeloyl-ACP methyl ester carboxylesterase